MPRSRPTSPALPFAGPVQLVWLKRDLRVCDHEPLARAAAAGPVVALYVFEPELLAAPEADRGHYGFLLEALAELDAALRRRGAALTVRRGAVPEVLGALAQELLPWGGIAHVHSHQETGNHRTYQRDLRVAAWLAERGIPWTEYHQDGVVRRLASRDGWAKRWQRRMQRDVLPAPAALRGVGLDAASAGGRFDHGALPTLDELGLPPTTITDRQRGGERLARGLLQSFLAERGERYRTAMSSPLSGWQACSRLSAHLALGTISLKSVHHALRERQAEVRALPAAERGAWGGSLQSFGGRLRWHCHFVQKLEDEPALEFEDLNRAFDGLRPVEPDDEGARRLAAWQQGRTGYPMVDACMRCLGTTGWLNFRMRAMLVSFAAYHLWLHWRPVGLWLARHFVDFEPGIHWSQVQMQSGTTGINTVRIYSPAKQLRDHDPDGVFVRRWLPELAGVPTARLAEPFAMTRAEQDAAGCRIGVDYAPPIVDHAEAVKRAKERIYAARRTPEARAEARRVYDKHGSRRRPRRPGAKTRPGAKA